MLRLWGKMKVLNVKIRNSGYVFCKSRFYSAHDVLNENVEYVFFTGVNQLVGEIDSGNWGISYLIGMYPYILEKTCLFLPTTALVNDVEFSLEKLAEFSCYMDTEFPLFDKQDTIRNLVQQGVEKSNLPESVDTIRELFQIDSQRFDRPLSGVGNEIFKAMSAIGFSYGKQIYCFPWLSKKRFEGYHRHMTDLICILESLGKVVILPIGE